MSKMNTSPEVSRDFAAGTWRETIYLHVVLVVLCLMMWHGYRYVIKLKYQQDVMGGSRITTSFFERWGSKYELFMHSQRISDKRLTPRDSIRPMASVITSDLHITLQVFSWHSNSLITYHQSSSSSSSSSSSWVFYYTHTTLFTFWKGSTIIRKKMKVNT